MASHTHRRDRLVAAAAGGLALLLAFGIVRAPVEPGTTVAPSHSLEAGSAAAASGSPPASGDAVPGPAAYRAPSIRRPLPDLDPGLARRGAHPSLASLAGYLYGDKPLVYLDPRAGPSDWHLSRPDPAAVSGYWDDVSVAPGGSIGLHLAGNDRRARLDVFRLGAGDAAHLMTVPSLPVAPLHVPRPQIATGLDEMGWPVAYRLVVPAGWRSGLYLARLSAVDGQSYVPFIVRPPRPVGLVVMIPLLTYQAYNSWNGASLYHWDGAPRGAPRRAYEVSFDRPYATEAGAALLFRTEFPLIVWLADHGYQAGYIADADLARDPAWATRARTIVVAGHAEYWTESMRAAVLAAEARGVGVVAFGGNLAYWQVRLEPDARGVPDRTIVCYKDAALDPLARTAPQLATTQFSSLPTPEPASEIFGADYRGIVLRTLPLVVTPAITLFAPDIGLPAGQRLPALLGGEIDSIAPSAHGIVLTSCLVQTGPHVSSPATACLTISPEGAHVFDAGTFSWSWGLDPRYAAALPGFPAAAFARLTASILAWAGTPPSSA